MDLQIYALCADLERNPPSPDPDFDCFCDPPDSLDEHAMIETLDSQFRTLLQTELPSFQVSSSSNNTTDQLAQILRAKEQCIQLCVARLSNLRRSMFQAINHEPQLIRLAARYYMEKDALVRRLGELVQDWPEEELPRDLRRLRQEHVQRISEMPYGRERAARVAEVIEKYASGVV